MSCAAWGETGAQDELPSASGAVSFNPRFLVGQAKDMELDFLSSAQPTVAGLYRADVYLNGSWKGRLSLEFEPGVDGAGTVCLDESTLETLGLKPPEIPARHGQQRRCRTIGEWFEGAQEEFDPSTLRYELSVPDIHISRLPRGHVSASSWERGINAASLGYQLNIVDARGREGTARQAGFLGLRAGLNLNGWQFRHDSSLSWARRHGREWQATATYVQRPLPSLRSQLVLGDAHTSGELFDSIGYRGVRLESDDRMLPDSLRGYAPVVRGIAETQATVEVHQNGQLLHTVSVPPGAFAIDDLYPTGYGGDLVVVIIEADGRERSFRVPYASVNRMLRAGMSRYSLALGRVRSTTLRRPPDILQATYQRGLSNALTLFGGAAASEGYLSLLAGAGVMTPLGEVALDWTRARTELQPASLDGSQSRTGTSLRLSYNNRLDATGTHVRLSAWRYSSGDFLGHLDAIHARERFRNDPSPLVPVGPRDRFQASLHQPLGQRAGTVYLTAALQETPAEGARARHYQLGYNHTWRRLSYGLSVSRSDGSDHPAETRYLATISLPLGTDGRRAVLNGSMGAGSGSTPRRLGLAGALGTDNQLRYGVTVAHSGSGERTASGNVHYTAAASELSASYAVGDDYRQATLGASGSLVAHPGGLSAVPRRGDTMAIVHAPGAHGARLQNTPGVRVDASGYAVVPHLSPYRLNTVTLDPRGMNPNVELLGSSRSIAPVAGAIGHLEFETRTGHALLVDVVRADGRHLPFGTRALDDSGRVVGMVGQGGVAYVRTALDAGTLQMRWGRGEEQSCRIEYQVPSGAARQQVGPMVRIEGACQ